MQTEPAQLKHTNRTRWVAGVSLIVAAIVGLGAWAILSPGALAYYKTPSEVREQGLLRQRDQKTLRIGGRVSHLRRAAGTIFITITDGHETIRAEYQGEVPDTLKQGTDAVVEGRGWTNEGDFAAERVQAKCSSKFVPKDRPGDLGQSRGKT